MESEWRWNVFAQGMSKSGWQLCAYWNVSPVIVMTVKESDTQWGIWLQYPYTVTQLPERVAGPYDIGAGDRFPYGTSVEPD